jgi:hypothetical protein
MTFYQPEYYSGTEQVSWLLCISTCDIHLKLPSVATIGGQCTPLFKGPFNIHIYVCNIIYRIDNTDTHISALNELGGWAVESRL